MRNKIGNAALQLASTCLATCRSHAEHFGSCASRVLAERSSSGCWASTSDYARPVGGMFGLTANGDRKFSTAPESTGAITTGASPLLNPTSPGSSSSPSSSRAEQLYGKSPSIHGIGRAGAKLRGISMSEKKLNYFAKLIRRMHVEDALAQCKLQPKKAGRIIAKVINSAMANAENNHGLDRSKLMIDIINLGRGKKRYELSPRAKGRANRINHALSHMEVILKESDKGPVMKFRKPLLERERKK